MNEELKPVCCGCGGASNIVKRLSRDYSVPVWYVECIKCNIETDDYFSESEAILAWNTAMGTNIRRLLEVLVHDATDTNVGDKERTAKVTTIEKPIEGSDSTISVSSCSQCSGVVSIFDTYCPNCGARLEWE